MQPDLVSYLLLPGNVTKKVVTNSYAYSDEAAFVRGHCLIDVLESPHMATAKSLVCEFNGIPVSVSRDAEQTDQELCEQYQTAIMEHAD